MSEIAPQPPAPRREAGPSLRTAAAILAFASVVLAIAELALVSGTAIFFLWIPLLALAGLVLALIAAGLVGSKLRSRRAAWALTAVVCAECCAAFGLLGWNVIDDHRRHERDLHSLEALGGMHGGSGGISFDIRRVRGERRVEMRIALAGVNLRSRPELWNVDCYSKDVHVYFGGPHAARATPVGATLDRSVRNSIEAWAVPLEHPSPYCSLDVSHFLGGEDDFIVWAPIRR